MPRTLDASAEPVVAESYVDASRRRVRVRPEVVAAIRAAMGLAPGASAPEVTVAVVRAGSALPVSGVVELEDGTELPPAARLPRDAPYGYHRLHAADGTTWTLLSGPARCPVPEERAWGWSVQLATTRSRRSWGIGDLADLRRLAEWSAGLGAGFVVVSPMGAPNPGPRPEPSPYYPSTRRFGNPLHLAIDAIPGIGEVDDLADEARALDLASTVDRERVAAVKGAALDRAWGARLAAAERDGLEAWRRERGVALERWATFATLAERFGSRWRSWPEEYRHPERASVARFGADEPDRVAFHAWVQWHLDRQLADASRAIRRIADVPVGVDPEGFDAWEWQDQVAIDASIGAPPDRFNSAGQDWGLPPLVPHRLRESGHRPFVDTIRAQLRHAGGIRIDHVLGLFRLWWIPGGAGPADGTYVRMPSDELLEIVAIEAHRAGAIVIGEDLGTVPAGVRRELRRRRILSTRLVLFERVSPARYPRGAFAAVTTHDLPTVAGALSGSDLADQAAAGVTPDPAALDTLRDRLLSAAGERSGASPRAVLEALHRRLAASPPVLVGSTIEDALGVERRPNLPGTVATQRDNWSAALPLPLEDIVVDGRVLAAARALDRG